MDPKYKESERIMGFFIQRPIFQKPKGDKKFVSGVVRYIIPSKDNYIYLISLNNILQTSNGKKYKIVSLEERLAAPYDIEIFEHIEYFLAENNWEEVKILMDFVRWLPKNCLLNNP